MPHEINADKASEIWIDAEPTFRLRKKLISRLAEIAALNKHWFQPADFRLTGKHIYRSGHNVMERNGLFSIRHLLLPPKCGSSKPIDRWRRKNYRKGNPPSLKEIELVRKVSDAFRWDRVADNWRCPICNRTKIEAIRKNNRNQSMLDIARSTFLGQKEEIYVCGDCLWVAREIGKEAKSLSEWDGDGLARFVKINELKHVIIPHPHSRHNIKNPQVEILLGKIVERMNHDLRQ